MERLWQSDRFIQGVNAMEHIAHVFGGGCGEHIVWPWLVASFSCVSAWCKCHFAKPTMCAGAAGLEPTISGVTTRRPAS